MDDTTSRYTQRIAGLPPYLFARIDELKVEKQAQGVDLIDLGVGDPDQPTPRHIVESLNHAACKSANHRYPSYEGLLSYREAVSEWYAKKGVQLDPADEVLALIGSKEGIAHIPLAFINPGETALVPDPAYPVYKIGTLLADGEPVAMPLAPDNGYLPDLEQTPTGAKMMFINYPNNPTAAVADVQFYREVVDFAVDNEIIVCHDAAYSEMTFDGYVAPSFLAFPGAMDVGIEFHSLSKTYNMTGWRMGFAVGNADILSGLAKVKANIDSGAFQAIQEAGITALQGPQVCVDDMRLLYAKRRDVFVKGLRTIGWDVEMPKATFYVWAPIPDGTPSIDFSLRLLDAGIVATPGVGFGDYGEGYIRFALTVPMRRIEQAISRLEKVT